MHRNAIHLIPAVFDSRLSLYIQRRKTPFAALADANAAMEAGHRFYRSPNDVILFDCGMGGSVNPEYLAGLFGYDMENPRIPFRACLFPLLVRVFALPPTRAGDVDGIRDR